MNLLDSGVLDELSDVPRPIRCTPTPQRRSIAILWLLPAYRTSCQSHGGTSRYDEPPTPTPPQRARRLDQTTVLLHVHLTVLRETANHHSTTESRMNDGMHFTPMLLQARISSIITSICKSVIPSNPVLLARCSKNRLHEDG